VTIVQLTCQFLCSRSPRDMEFWWSHICLILRIYFKSLISSCLDFWSARNNSNAWRWTGRTCELHFKAILSIWNRNDEHNDKGRVEKGRDLKMRTGVWRPISA
jgi:hypothetical protein